MKVNFQILGNATVGVQEVSTAENTVPPVTSTELSNTSTEPLRTSTEEIADPTTEAAPIRERLIALKGQ